MALKYGKFEMPEMIKVDEATRSTTFSRFIIEAFEKGFAHSIGNPLRRIMHTSLEAPAIVSVRIEGVPHEYTAIDGIVEDMTRIVLNFKGALFRYLPEEERERRKMHMVSKKLEVTSAMLQENGGQYAVRLRDVVGPCAFEMVDPDLHLFTVTQECSRTIDLKIAIGRGYVPADRHKVDRLIDEIVIDSAFSPVKLVNYYVENTRVGQDTDFDRLIFEITTDGRVTPEEALSFAAQIGIQHFAVFDHVKPHSISFDEGEIESNKDFDDLMSKLSLKIGEIELSVRSTNCLQSADINTIGELVIMPESEMLRFRNFGKKSLTEIKEKLEEMSLHLGMDLSRYGITRDTIKAMIDQHLEEKSGVDA
ncbi:MAG: DNA-directed RNA polymerase subunit alpha [Chlamydiota bacterium]